MRKAFKFHIYSSPWTTEIIISAQELSLISHLRSEFESRLEVRFIVEGFLGGRVRALPKISSQLKLLGEESLNESPSQILKSQRCGMAGGWGQKVQTRGDEVG